MDMLHLETGAIRTTRPFGRFEWIKDFRKWACRNFDIDADEVLKVVDGDGIELSGHAAFPYGGSLRLYSRNRNVVVATFVFDYTALRAMTE